MPIIIPRLDDRSYEDLIAELLERIPAHTPEWTSPQPGDPGQTILELFAWLADIVLYRANLIPERQRLAFLNLLGMNPRPARPSHGLVTVRWDEETLPVEPLVLRPLCSVDGPVPFETRAELAVQPVTAMMYYKRRATAQEVRQMGPIIEGLKNLYGIEGQAQPYITTTLFEDSVLNPTGIDLARQATDQSLWFALLAPTPQVVADARAQMAGQPLHIGLAPPEARPLEPGQTPPQRNLPIAWEVGITEPVTGRFAMVGVDVLSDTTQDMMQRGVVRLRLPGGELSAPPNDPGQNLMAGVGHRPPRVDDPDIAARIVTWVCMRPMRPMQQWALGWAGINAVRIDQRRTLRNIVIGQSDGTASQTFSLGATSIESETLRVQVEEVGLGFQTWRVVAFLAGESRDARVFTLDDQAGTITFGDGVRGRIPQATGRIRVDLMRSGGGRAGNLAAGTLNAMTAFDVRGQRVTAIEVHQPLPTTHGDDAETIEQAEQRIPLMLRHRNRAVTTQDYKQLALETPGIRLARVEVLPRFKPTDLEHNVPGVITVMVWPQQAQMDPPAPRIDMSMAHAVHSWLDERKVLGTELYVVGPQYVPVGISVAVRLRPDAERAATLNMIHQQLRAYFFALAPGGHGGQGWALGERVSALEAEVVVARVPGVAAVMDIELFFAGEGQWRHVGVPGRRRRYFDRTQQEDAQISLRPWQLPELLSIRVVEADEAPLSLPGANVAQSGAPSIGIPVVPEVC